MRRFILIPVVMAAVVLSAAVPALKAAAQLVGVQTTADQLVQTTADQLVQTTSDQLGAITSDQLVTLPPPPPTLVGMLVDSSCYATLGNNVTSGDHAKCAIACAQKGHRLAIVTSKGDVYMVTGAFTQENNTRLIAFVNQTVAVVGTVGVRLPDPPPPLAISKTDTRRPLGTQDGLVVAKVVKTGDTKEGDTPDASETTIEITSILLAGGK